MCNGGAAGPSNSCNLSDHFVRVTFSFEERLRKGCWRRMHHHGRLARSGRRLVTVLCCKFRRSRGAELFASFSGLHGKEVRGNQVLQNGISPGIALFRLPSSEGCAEDAIYRPAMLPGGFGLLTVPLRLFDSRNKRCILRLNVARPKVAPCFRDIAYTWRAKLLLLSQMPLLGRVSFSAPSMKHHGQLKSCRSTPPPPSL